MYIGSTQALNTWISLHKSNIKLPENRKLYVLKHLYKCISGLFRRMPIYHTVNYTLLKIKGKNLIEKFKPHQTELDYTHTKTDTHTLSLKIKIFLID